MDEHKREDNGEPAGGLTTFCAWCKKKQVGDEWVDEELDPHEFELASHGICPECFKKTILRMEARKKSRQ